MIPGDSLSNLAEVPRGSEALLCGAEWGGRGGGAENQI